MVRPVRNAANSVAMAAQEADNTARWATIVLSKINEILDNLKTAQHLDIEVDVPLGDNVAHLFGKDHLTIDGKPVVLQIAVRVKLPETTADVSVETEENPS